MMGLVFLVISIFCLHRALYKIHTWKLFAHGKIKSRRKSLVGKKKMKKKFWTKEERKKEYHSVKKRKKILHDSDQYRRCSVLESRFPA